MQRFSHRSEGSEPHIRLPRLGRLAPGRGAPRALGFETSGAELQEPHKTEGKQTTLGTHTRSHLHRDPGQKQSFYRSLGQTYLLLLEGLLGKGCSCGRLRTTGGSHI